MNRKLFHSFLPAIATCVCAFAAVTTHAATFTVTRTTDSGAGSLRQAILSANATTGADTIVFGFSGAVVRITPITPLPVITDSVTINGLDPKGIRPTIELSGKTARGTGLAIQANDCNVKGLILNSFDVGILINGNHNVISGNYIGTDATGTRAVANQIGVRINSGSRNWIGVLARNLISGNSVGIVVGQFFYDRTSENFIETNTIGTNIAGLALPNYVGIYLLSGEYSSIWGNLISGSVVGIKQGGYDAVVGAVVGWVHNGSVEKSFIQNNTIIGTNIFGSALSNGAGIEINGSRAWSSQTTIDGNVIYGHGIGIHLAEAGDVGGNYVVRNYIGTDRTGTAAFGNGVGILVRSYANTIGDPSAVVPSGNVIAFNGIGVAKESISGAEGEASKIRGNSIYSQVGGLGIDWGQDGVNFGSWPSPFPYLLDAVTDGSSIGVAGVLWVAPLSPLRERIIDFYSNPTCHPTGFGEGRTFLGSQTVTLDNNGFAAVSVNFLHHVPYGHYITATATGGDLQTTSEFSNCEQAHPPVN